MKDLNRYLKNDKGVHIGHPEYDTTLCGDAEEGEDENTECETVNRQPVTCPTCLAMISAARSACT